MKSQLKQDQLVPDNEELTPMKLAREESKKSIHKFQIGATIIKRNRVLSKACNIYKTHPIFGYL